MMRTSDSPTLAIIGGTGLNSMANFEVSADQLPETFYETPYGAPSAPLQKGLLQGRPIAFMPRHGVGHRLAPHAINYRANIWAMREAGIKAVVAVAAVGSMRKDFSPGAIAVPNQLIDYTWGREHSFDHDSDATVTHIEFEEPYDETLRQRLLMAASAAGVSCLENGCYACTQGPRLETAAEVQRLIRDGNDMVGMTAMPEAALAREAGLAYACIAVSVNWAAGLGTAGEGIHAQIEQAIQSGMQKTAAVIAAL